MADRIGNMRAVRPADSIIEQAKLRNRKPAKLYDFNPLFDDKRRREPPQYCRRVDDICLFYHGKENAIYGETEAGKDMLLCETVIQALEDMKIIAWIDFEEGNEIDLGERLREMGAERDQVCDQDFFMFSTPEDVDAAQDSVWDAIKKHVDIVVFNGVQSAYGLFGWELYDPSSPALFRRALVSPLLKRGCTVIGTDHMTKTSAEGKNGSRYAAGGIAKLNWINGAAYMLEAVTPIIRGSVGTSRLLLTKDRPGSIKPTCKRIDREPRMMNAGLLVVKSTGDGPVDDPDTKYSLTVQIEAPIPGSVIRARAKAKDEGVPQDNDVPDEVLKKVLSLYKQAGAGGASKRNIEDAYHGNGARQVRPAIAILYTNGCLAKASPSKSSNMAQLRYAKDWNPDQ